MPKEIVQHVIDDVSVAYGDMVWLLRGDAPGLPEFCRPDPETGRLTAPYERFDEFLLTAVTPDQFTALEEAIGSDSWPPVARMKAAVAAWKNAVGYGSIEDETARYGRLLAEANGRIEKAITELKDDSPEDGGNPLDET